MALTTTGGASILTPEEVGTLVVRPLMEQSVAAQVSTVIPTNSHDFRVPIVSADPTAAWTAEGAEISVSDPTITELTVTPKKLAGLTVITYELAADSSPAALQVVGDGLVRDLKRKLDAAYFGNTTTNGPNGLGSLTTTVIDVGDAWTNLDAFEGAKSAAETLHTELGAFVTNPTTALALASLKEGPTRTSRSSAPTPPHRHPVLSAVSRSTSVPKWAPTSCGESRWRTACSSTAKTPPSSPTPASSSPVTGWQCGPRSAPRSGSPSRSAS